MRRTLSALIVLTALLVIAAPPRASADDASFKDVHPNAGQGIVQPPPPAPADSGEKPEKSAPTFAFFVAVVATIAVMCILCVPSRKAESSSARR